MVAKYFSPVDFVNNEIRNVGAQALASDPGSPFAGQFWYNTTSGKFKFRNGSTSIDPLDRTNHTGTQLAATISDLATTVQAYRLDQLAAPTAAVSFNSQRITSLATPTTASDAATKAYVDALINGFDWKNACRVASTANVTVASPGATIDGVTMVSGDRVLLKNQTTASENGIYTWNGAAVAMTRTADATTGTLTANTTVYVSEGTAGAETSWTLTTNDPITVGTTSLAFAQTGGGGGTVTGGTGINVASNVVSVDTAVVVRKYAATIGDGTSTSIAVTHSLGSQDVTWSLRQVSDNAFCYVDAVATSASVLTFNFTTAPAASSLRVVVHV